MGVEGKNSRDFLQKYLRQWGYRYTEQRLTVFEAVIHQTGKHLSSEEVFESVRRRRPGISLATVYRTLQLLEDIGLLNKIDLNDKVVRYELNKQDEGNHCHLVCIRCGGVHEIKTELVTLLERFILYETNFKVKRKSVNFYGYCEACMKEEPGVWLKGLLRVKSVAKAEERGEYMSIVVVGGHDRMHEEYREICERRGHNVKIYTQMPARFDKAIGRPDGIVLFTSTVSHKMVNTAVKEAKRRNIRLVRSHSSSATSLDGLIREMEMNTACPAPNFPG